MSKKSVRRKKVVNMDSFLNKMVEEHGSPLMIIKKDILKKQYDNFCSRLPKIEPFYALKANPHPQIIEFFAKQGCGFDVASAAEIEWALQAGANPEKILFANTIKSDKDLQFAKRKNIDWMTFDSEPELYKIAKHCPGARVILRIRVPNVGSVVELSLKFGADPEHGVFMLNKARSLVLIPDGISFHVGSQCTTVTNYTNALEIASEIFTEAEKKGMALNTLDIGGGFPIKHFDGEKINTLDKMARLINRDIKKNFRKDIRVIAEPGRYFVGPAGILVTQVVGWTFRNNKNFYYLNDGVYQDFSGMIFDHCEYQFKTLRRGQKYLSALAGPTCDSLDILSANEELPELDVGDIVYVKNIGAYSSASATPAFNGFEPAKILVI